MSETNQSQAVETVFADHVLECSHRITSCWLTDALFKLQRASESPYPEIYHTPQIAETVRQCRDVIAILERLTTNQGDHP